jgi:hypothetical protein
MRVFTSAKLFNDYANRLNDAGAMFLMRVHTTPKGKDFWTINEVI